MTEKHDVSDVPTTGHLWDDDLADLTNQPPKWWMLGLIASGKFDPSPVTTHLVSWEDAASALLELPVKLVAVRE